MTAIEEPNVRAWVAVMERTTEGLLVTVIERTRGKG